MCLYIICKGVLLVSLHDFGLDLISIIGKSCDYCMCFYIWSRWVFSLVKVKTVHLVILLDPPNNVDLIDEWIKSKNAVRQKLSFELLLSIVDALKMNRVNITIR